MSANKTKSKPTSNKSNCLHFRIMFPHKTALINSKFWYHLITIPVQLFICVYLEAKKMRLPLLLHLPLKQVGTRGSIIPSRIILKDAGILLFAVFAQLQSRCEKLGKMQAEHIWSSPDLLTTQKGKLIKEEIPHSIFFPHHNFSIFFREMPANN